MFFMPDDDKVTFRIREDLLPKLQKQIDKLNRHAKKLALPPVTLTATEGNDPIVRCRDHGRGINTDLCVPWCPRVYIAFFDVEISGVAPKANGYVMLGKIEHSEEGNIIRSLGEDIPTEFRTADRVCAHCKTSRYRKDTFVLRGADGTIVQVGRNCLADFLRSEAYARQLTEYYEFLSSIWTRGGGDGDPDAEDDVSWGRVTPRYAVKEVVEMATAAIREHGYVSRTKQKEIEEKVGEFGFVPETTTNRVDNALNLWRFVDAKTRDAVRITPTEDDKTEAAAALAWAQALPGVSDYEHNLRLLTARDYIEGKHLGYICSIPTAYARAMDRLKREQEPKVEKPVSQFVGEPKQRLRDVELTLIKDIVIDTEFGTISIYRFEDAAGNTFIWKSSKCIDVKEGATVKVTGTIKEHSVYRDERQTVLTRCKVEAA